MMVLEKGTIVYIYDLKFDKIGQYEFDSERDSNEKYWNKDYKPLYRVTKNGESVPFLFKMEQLHLTEKEAEAERNQWEKEIKKEFLQDGIIKVLFDGWLNPSDDVQCKLDEDIMRSLIKETYGIDV